MNLGGPDGDDRTTVDMNNENVLNALGFYKELNQSLYFDGEEVEYNALLQKAFGGKSFIYHRHNEKLRASQTEWNELWNCCHSTFDR